MAERPGQELRRALENQSFILNFQPIFHLGTRRIVGAEALLRWSHPRRGCLGPDSFLSRAESNGLVPALDRWSLRAACRRFSQWRLDLPDIEDLNLAVNVSPWTLDAGRYPQEALATVADTGLPPDRLVLEVTERGRLSRQTCDVLARLRDEGIRIAIDDFGKEGSSVERLASMPVDRLKLDRALTLATAAGHRGRNVVRGVVRLARDLGAEVVAEGIEHEEEIRWLRDTGCRLGQGYLCGRPLESAEFRRALRSVGPPSPTCPTPETPGRNAPAIPPDPTLRHPAIEPVMLEAFGAWPAAGRIA